MSKENTNQKEVAEGIVDRFLARPTVVKATLALRTLKPLAYIYIPLGLATYILHSQSDKIVLAIGVALGLLSIVNTSKTAFSSVKLATNSKRRK